MSKSKVSKENEKKISIKEQVEHYLSDENLKKDSFFHNKISENQNGYLDLDFLLKCNKIKKAGWSKEDLIEGIKLSEVIELDDTNDKVRRKDNKPLPELVLLTQKRTKPEKEEKEEEKEEVKKEEIKEEKKEEKEEVKKEEKEEEKEEVKKKFNH